MVTLGSLPDLLRLLAVPVFAWTAYRDIKTRRVPNRTWLPLLGLGILALLIESYQVLTDGTITPVDPQVFLIQVVISIGLIVPLAYGFWWIGGFGGADAKALITLAVLFPTFPTYFLPGAALPLVEPTVGVFSLTVLSNTVLAGIAYPFALAARNAISGRFSKVMFFGRPIRWDDATEEYGRLLETPDGFTRGGLDLDALRMYLNWRGATLSEVRADPDHHRDPTSIPAETNPPGDGAIPVTDGGRPDEAEMTDGESETAATESETDTTAPDTEPTDPAVDDGEAAIADPWGAAQFLESIEGSAYGTSPEQLRDGLEVLTEEDVVWITPGIPFLVPMFVGLVVGLTYGDVIFALLGVGGLT